MSTTPRCAICDCDRDGNVWPESAESLCAAHWLASSVRNLVRAGAWSEWPQNKFGVAPNHQQMMLTRDVQEAEKRHPWQAVVLASCNAYTIRHGYGVPVWWDDGTNDTTDSEGDRYAAMTGLVASWVWQAVERALMERTSGGRAA